MFQRFRDAIDKTVAEEQARSKEQQAASSRSASTARRPQVKKTNSDVKATDAAPNPDPAVFEEAFVIDDEDDPSRAGTPKPAPPEKDNVSPSETKEEGAMNEKTNEKPVDGKEKDDGVAKEKGADDATSTASPPLSPEVKKKLHKLEKMEKAYPELLRSYRLAHRRVTAIDHFEKTVRDNTSAPFTSIADPSSLTEYIGSLDRKSDLVMEELKRVSAERDEFKKQREEAEAKLTEPVTEDKPETPRQSTEQAASAEPDKVKSPVASVIGMFSPRQKAAEKSEEKEDGDFFSYDEEIPQLQSALEAKSEKIKDLLGKVDQQGGLIDSATSELRRVRDDLERANQRAREHETEVEDQTQQLDHLRNQLDTTDRALQETEAKLAAAEESHAVHAKELEASQAASDKRANELNTELTNASSAETGSKKLIDTLNTQITTLKKEQTESETRIGELTKRLESQPAPKAEPTSSAQAAPTVAPATGGSNKKKNNKKKKGKGGAAAAVAQTSEEGIPEANEPGPISAQDTSRSELESVVSRLKEDLVDKEARIEELVAQRKNVEDLQEQKETLEESLVAIGDDHTQAKDRIKALEAEKADYAEAQGKIQALQEEKAKLEATISELRKKISSSANSDAQASGKHQSEMGKLQKDYDELKDKSATLQSDLGAAQQLAQTRFKDLSELKEVLQKAQPELKSLRQESTTLKATKDELATKTKELKEAEKNEKDLKRDLSRAQQQATDQETEVKFVQEKLTVESAAKARLEDEKRVQGRDLRRAESEKADTSAKSEIAEKELAKVQEEVSKLRPRVKELEEQMHKLRRDNVAAQEEVDFKTQQYSNAQGLLTSMRDQVAESSVQLNESKSQADSLEEELADAQRLLQERTRDAENMRRLLADDNGRADAKLRDMKARMEAAIEERDRIEEESSTSARRKARETEDFKGKIRELEREVKTLGRERDELEEREKEWRRRKEELDSVEEKADAEAAEMRSTVSQLRSALDASEGQVRDAEKQRTELRKLLDDARQRYERAQRELKGTQAKLVAGSSRSSMDSNRSGTPANGQAPGGGDLMYLKTILLQFLEQKDGKLRAQLVPVLGKLLQFNKAEEQKWSSAVQHIEVR